MTDLCSYMQLYFYILMHKGYQDADLHVCPETVERDIVAGFNHPAFREICESRVFKVGSFKAYKTG